MPGNPVAAPPMSLLRADDLLSLRFEFVNLNLDTGAQGNGSQAPRLTRAQPGQQALMIVQFPPQHLVERVFDEDAFGNIADLQSPPIAAVMSRSSRLVFELPADLMEIPLTTEALLDWSRLKLVVAANALPDPPVVNSQPPPPPAEPTARMTAIELPYRLVISPDNSARWAHSARAVTAPGGRTELWHTRLAGPANGQSNHLPLPAVRAVWSHDNDPTSRADASRSATTDIDRKNIVTGSSDFSTGIPSALTTEYLMLSSLGGWADLGLALNPPVGGLVSWRHIASMGRDQYVRIVTSGFLYPFGHRASLVKVRERRLSQTSGTTEYLVGKTILVVQEPAKDYGPLAALYEHGGNEMPLRRVRIATLVTPVLSPTPAQPADVPRVSGVPFRFHLLAEDWSGAKVEFSIPLVYVTPGIPKDFLVAESAFREFKRADLRNQAVAFAPSQQHGDTHLKTSSMSFSAQIGGKGAPLNPPLLPAMVDAEVSIPAADQLLGSSGGPGGKTIAFHDHYLTNGFGPANGIQQVFARIVEPAGTKQDPMKLPAERAGGIVTPSMVVDGLSRSLGPIPQVNNIVNGSFTPQDSLGALGGKLLGMFDLKDIISAVSSGAGPGASLDQQVPKLLQNRLPNALDTSFEWNPKVRVPAQAPLLTKDTTGLNIKVHTIAPFDGTPPTTTVDGLLTNFAVEFADVITVDFESLRFHSETGKKAELTPKGIDIRFHGALGFVNELSQILPRDGFGEGASLTVTPEGISTGYTLGLPPAAVGAFSLENISLSAQLLLPFTDRPAGLRMAFSERAHPFLVTMSLIGGGGFFAVDLDCNGINQLEASVEMGGNISINLFVTSANVHVMAGFHFGMNDSGLDVSAYLRVGGSVELLGVAGISIELYVALVFETGKPDRFRGEASLAVGVHLLFFATSITVRVEKEFDFPALADPTFEDMISLPDWNLYCQAFAPEA